MPKTNNQGNKSKYPTAVKTFDAYDFAHLGHNQPTKAQFAYLLSEAPRAKLTKDDATSCICCLNAWTFDGKVTATRLACNHLICRDCAPQWFGRPKKTCPTCRAVLMTCEEALEEHNIVPDMQDENLEDDEEGDGAILADSIDHLLSGTMRHFVRTLDNERENSAVITLQMLCGGLSAFLEEIRQTRQRIRDEVAGLRNDMTRVEGPDEELEVV
ncbi:hypothetical protein LTR78_007207 [Recurvomyces mirabilis]|uniref:RING-type domain-containing protein n=1 Tax=Recurvomyces mirabilis TaxID=574656 RepID=A0AAE0WJH5_9PEZI|nr:hypothetical protein LTR78_007207 [Recurvomyces mirabilis]KAK5155550.1 hypothetical protein LTS14_005811 [Recurvomyces mirabilis]